MPIQNMVLPPTSTSYLRTKVRHAPTEDTLDGVMRIVDAQIHLWGSGLPSNMAHRQVTSFTTEEAVGLMDELSLIHI